MHVPSWLVSSRNFYIILIGVMVVTGVVTAVVVELHTSKGSINEIGSVAKQLVIKTGEGEIEISLAKETSVGVAVVGLLATKGFYNHTKVSRIVTDFWVEIGEARTANMPRYKWGSGGYEVSYAVEPSEGMVRGAVVLINDGRGHNGTKWLILTQDAPWLAGDFTRLGEVTSGMEIIDRWVQRPVGVTGIPNDEIVLDRIELREGE